jgi:tRNA(Leu) C34 or U34 (ribose-2'-O)-methylase TrmL
MGSADFLHANILCLLCPPAKRRAMIMIEEQLCPEHGIPMEEVYFCREEPTKPSASRGYAVVGLSQPKNAVNVGGVLRAAHCFGASMVVVSGKRFRASQLLTDTHKAWRHMPLLYVDAILDTIPHDCVPVAVDLLEGARPLHRYTHPDRAFYIFGAEDQTLPPGIVRKCRDRVMVATDRCMNLAACVNVVLYDRAAKRDEWPARA